MTRHKSEVRDWMTENLITISSDASLLDAFGLMTENDVRRLPVVANNELVGMITLSDIQRAVPLSDAAAQADSETGREYLLNSHTVRSVMAADPISVEPQDTIQDAAEAMLEYQVSGLPVVLGTEVVGIVTESDIFRLVVESWSPVMA